MIRIEQETGVVHLIIDRLEKKNALTRGMYEALADAVDEATANPSVHAIVITGEGAQFTAGNDLDDFRARAAEKNAPAVSWPGVYRATDELRHTGDRGRGRSCDWHRHHDADAL